MYLLSICHKKYSLVKNYILYILSILLLTACTPLANLSPAKYPIEPIKKEEFQKLNGTYKNFQDAVFGQVEHFPDNVKNGNNKCLIERLFMIFPNKTYKSTTVEIKFISRKKAVVNAYQNDTIIFSKKIRGRFKKGYFYIRPKILIIPFYPILFGYGFERTRIGKSGNDLVVDYTIKSWGFLLIAGGEERGATTSIYKSIKK